MERSTFKGKVMWCYFWKQN